MKSHISNAPLKFIKKNSKTLETTKGFGENFEKSISWE
jgi:hypothetical protein